LVRNACIALGNAEADQNEETAHRITSLLTELSANEDQVIAESARWALRRIQERGSREGSGRGAN
jgi:epoxyqueuosine reductase QueG